MAATSIALRNRIRDVQQRVSQAAAGRDVTLIAVSKKQSIDAILQAYDAGITDFGENNAQELEHKACALADMGYRPRWHFLGHLQRNKVKSIIPVVSMLHSLDSTRLAAAVQQHVSAPLNVLIQVNLGREVQKNGVLMDHLLQLVEDVSQFNYLKLCGLMTVPPAHADPIPYFQQLAVLLKTLHLTVLSMGMSHDFEQAIQYGATCVRVGSAIFGERDR